MSDGSEVFFLLGLTLIIQIVFKVFGGFGCNFFFLFRSAISTRTLIFPILCSSVYLKPDLFVIRYPFLRPSAMFSSCRTSSTTVIICTFGLPHTYVPKVRFPKSIMCCIPTKKKLNKYLLSSELKTFLFFRTKCTYFSSETLIDSVML